MLKSPRSDVVETMKFGALAGAAGGVAEIVWISLYAAVAGVDVAPVARGVGEAFGIPLAAASAGLGLAIHVGLAVALGVALAFGWKAARLRVARAREQHTRYAATVLALTIVWAVNFFVVLPLISPGFVQLLPYQISLVSKLLFGLAVAATLWSPGRSVAARSGPGR